MITAFPNAAILEAFGLVGEPVAMSGGRGLCYRVGGTVLRPSEDDIEARWIAELAIRLPASSRYRLAHPRQVIGQPGVFVQKGWTASSLLTGEVKAKPDFDKILDVSRSFHRDIRELDLERPAFIDQHPNRWREADLVTWEEKNLKDVDNINLEMLAEFQPMLDRLKKLIRPLVPQLEQQIIHGDITGNILFDNDEPPGIIDMTPYWRPVEYANAIVVVDALAWYREEESLVARYAVDSVREQLLARALYWRCLTFLIDTDMDWIQSHLVNTHYPYAIDIVCHLIED